MARIRLRISSNAARRRRASTAADIAASTGSRRLALSTLSGTATPSLSAVARNTPRRPTPGVAAKVRVASWVLSPSSARNTLTNTIASVFIVRLLCDGARSDGRQPDDEARAAAGAALDGEGAAVRGHDRARDGEAETDATDVAGAGVVEADEGLEDPLGVRGRDARARVLDHEERGLAVARHRGP